MTMTDKERDIGQLASEIEAVRNRVPSEAQALQDRCLQILKRISAAKGLFSPKREELNAIWEEIQTLRQESDALDPLLAAIRTARVVVEELSAEPAINAHVDAKIQELYEEWLPLLDHIARVVGDARAAAPALEQVNQLREWARSRRLAAHLIRSVSELHARSFGNANAVLAEVMRTWTEVFQQDRIDEGWLADARSHLEVLRNEFSPERHGVDRTGAQSIPSTTAAAAPPVLAALATSGWTDVAAEPSRYAEPVRYTEPVRQIEPEPVAAEPAEEPSMVLFHINTSLAECSDLARALGLESGEISELDKRMQDLENDPSGNSAAVKKLREDLRVYQASLSEKANAAKEERLKKLQRRWRQFQSIYSDQQYSTGAYVQRAEELKSDSPARLTTFFQSVDEALNNINFTAEGDRPPLAQAIRQRVEMCAALAEEIRQQPRTIAVDTALAQQERRVPKANLPISAESSFECLDICESVYGEFEALKQQNEQKRQDLAARGEQLQKLATLIDSTGNAQAGATAMSLLEQLAEQRSASPWLDQTESLLGRIEQALQIKRKEVQQRAAQDLVKLRRENLGWSRVLIEFSPDAESLGTKTPPPEELEALRVRSISRKPAPAKDRDPGGRGHAAAQPAQGRSGHTSPQAPGQSRIRDASGAGSGGGSCRIAGIYSAACDAAGSDLV